MALDGTRFLKTLDPRLWKTLLRLSIVEQLLQPGFNMGVIQLNWEKLMKVLEFALFGVVIIAIFLF